ncbi:hypothetical protein D3C75_1219380 [compost metagenome]
MGIELDDCPGTKKREYVSLQPAEHSLCVARRPLRHHPGIPIERNAFEGSAIDHGLHLGLLLGLDRVNAVGELLFELEALVASVSQPDHWVVAK